MEDKNPITPHLREKYTKYRSSQSTLFSHPQNTARFFSPTCHQVCRQIPSFSAVERETIIRYLQESREKPEDSGAEEVGKSGDGSKDGEGGGNENSWRLRELSAGEEKDLPEEFQERRKEENWEGRRVVMWDAVGEEIDGKRRVIVVNYWWKKEKVPEDGDEDEVWKQCLHDIIWIGKEGEWPEGLVKEEEVDPA